MKRIVLACLLTCSAFGQAFSPAELKENIATNLLTGAGFTARLLRETLTNVVTSTLFVTNNLSDLDDVVAARDNLGLAIGTNVMGFGTNLTALEGLTTVADRVPYFTGAATASLATFTAAGRALVDDADATAQRTTLGIAIGSNVQAYDADLGLYAAISPSSNVQTLLGSANYASFRAALGIDPSVISSGTATLVGGTVTVSHAAVTASSRIVVTGNADGGTPGWLRVSARSAGATFTITSSSGADTSTVAWILAEP